MDPKLLLCSSQVSTAFPLFLTNSLCNQKRTNISFQSVSKSSFLGKNLSLHRHSFQFDRPKTPINITCVVKRRKELPFDNVIQRDKKLKLVLKVRNILVNQPDRIMSLRDLGRYRRDLGLTRKRRFIALLKRFPGVFEIVEEGVYSLKFRLTPEAESVYLEELRVRNEMEQKLVVKLRKLLMMSLDKRILVEKIAHLKADLGLPTDFRDTICKRYPQYFKVVSTDRGPALELTHWDPELAIAAAEVAEEEKRIKEADERNLIIDRPPRFKRAKLPKGLNLTKGELRRITMFNEIPFISPYSDFSELKSNTSEKEKHACAVIHEMLSLTLEKRTLVDHLTHFREEFKFSQQLRGMLIRHPDMFYVSLKGERDSVFLREAYHNSQLIEKDKILILKEKMRALVAVPRFSKRSPRNKDDGDNNEDGEKSNEEYEEDGSEDWSDVDNVLSDGGDGGDDGEDDWSDEDDDMPPAFDDGDDLSVDGRKTNNGSVNNVETARVPVLPDGRPRERW